MRTMLNVGMLVVVLEPGTNLQRAILIGGACCHDVVAADVIGVIDDHVAVPLCNEDDYRCDVCGGLLDS